MNNNNRQTVCLGLYNNSDEAELQLTNWRDRNPDLVLEDYSYDPLTMKLWVTYSDLEVLNPQIEHQAIIDIDGNQPSYNQL